MKLQEPNCNLPLRSARAAGCFPVIYEIGDASKVQTIRDRDYVARN